MKPLRWGILGAANIARKNWKAIALSGNSVLTAVASRNLEKGQRFIAECQAHTPLETAPDAYGNYEALLSSDVDAVYIPLPTGLRKEWVLRAAAAGKHVLCEKPCAVTLNDLKEMIDACRRNRVQFLDGVMFMHSQRLPRVREVLDDGQSVGSLRRITSAFSFGAPPEFFAANIRGDSHLEPHGCIGDLGWYCIRLSLWAMNWQVPKAITGRILSQTEGKSGRAGVPTEFSGEMIFDGNISASFYCSFITENQEWALLSGKRGYLHLPDFVLPFPGDNVNFTVFNHAFKSSGCDFRMEPNALPVTLPEHSHSHPTAQETNMFRNFADQVNSGKLNEDWPKWALLTQQAMAACLEAAGLQ
jgi:predicted dehydrogenase